MLEIPFSFLSSFRVYFRTHADIQLEVLALRHQVTVLQRTNPKPKLRPADRRLWVWLSRSWSRWRSALVIVKPDTVLDWHRRGFRWYWTWKVRHGKAGRPSVPKATRELIRTMSRDNVLWGAPRIHSELLKLGIPVSQASVANATFQTSVTFAFWNSLAGRSGRSFEPNGTWRMPGMSRFLPMVGRYCMANLTKRVAT